MRPGQPGARHAIFQALLKDVIAFGIADAPDWRAGADGRARDREYDRQQGLKRQLELLHEGTLLSEPGRTYERLADLDQRIDELNTRIAMLRARLASHLQQAKALLAEPVTR